MRRTDDEIVGRRPVVATLDTGCGKHPWLAGRGEARAAASTASRSATSTTRPTRRSGSTRWVPSTAASTPWPGTAPSSPGLIHQACPDADIVAWRIVGSDGPVVESDLVKALGDIAEVARRHRDGEDGGHPIDVLSLSMGYYHETPEDLLFDPTMYDILRAASASAASRWSARPATTPPRGRCSRRPSRPGPTARAVSRRPPASSRSSRSGR